MKKCKNCKEKSKEEFCSSTCFYLFSDAQKMKKMKKYIVTTKEEIISQYIVEAENGNEAT